MTLRRFVAVVRVVTLSVVVVKSAPQSPSVARKQDSVATDTPS